MQSLPSIQLIVHPHNYAIKYSTARLSKGPQVNHDVGKAKEALIGDIAVDAINIALQF
jgi:hypothetical protein